jgi:hypothetical protein
MDFLRLCKAGDNRGAYEKIAAHALNDIIVAMSEVAEELTDARERNMLIALESLLLDHCREQKKTKRK